MRASSATALAAARDTLVAAVGSDAEVARDAAHELFAVADLVHANPKLAGALTDPTRLAADRSRLAETVFRSVSEPVRRTLAAMAANRWSAAGDFVDAADDLGAQALAFHAHLSGTVTQLQEQLFAIEEVLADNRDLRVALTDRSRLEPDQRVELARKVFAGKVSTDALNLLERAVGAPATVPVLSGLKRYRTDVAAIEDYAIATVRAASMPSPAQLERLRSILTKKLGRQVLLNVAEDPRCVGGMRVSVGSTIYDGSIRAALDGAERVLAGKARQ